MSEIFQCILQFYIIIVLKIVLKSVDVRNIKIPHLFSEKFLQIGLYCSGKVNLNFFKESCTPHYFESMQLSSSKKINLKIGL